MCVGTFWAQTSLMLYYFNTRIPAVCDKNTFTDQRLPAFHQFYVTELVETPLCDFVTIHINVSLNKART